MGHFDVAFCADFVRGIVGAEDRAALERHVANCPGCAANLRWLIDVAALTAADARYEPPAELLTRADAMFATANLGSAAPPCPARPEQARSEPGDVSASSRGN